LDTHQLIFEISAVAYRSHQLQFCKLKNVKYSDYKR